jgi:hypothetical protein
MLNLGCMFEEIATNVRIISGGPEFLPVFFSDRAENNGQHSGLSGGYYWPVTSGTSPTKTIGKRYLTTLYKNPYLPCDSDMRFDMATVFGSVNP